MIALPERRGARPASHVLRCNRRFPRRNVEAVDRAVDQFERDEGLEERDQMPGLVDAHEGEFAGLLDLPVHDAVRGRNVPEAGARVARRVDVRCHDLSAQPIAVVVCVAEVHGHADVGSQEGLHGFDGADLAVVVAGRGKCVAYCGVRLAVVDVGADGGLDFGGV